MYLPVYTKPQELSHRAHYIAYEVEHIKQAVVGALLMGEPIDVNDPNELIVAAYYFGAVNPPAMFVSSGLKVQDGD